VRKYGCALRFADESLRKNYDIVLATATQDGHALQFADESFRKNYDIVLAAVIQYGRALQFADESLMKNYDIVLAAVIQDGHALQFADKKLRDDEYFLSTLLNEGAVFKFIVRYANQRICNEYDEYSLRILTLHIKGAYCD